MTDLPNGRQVRLSDFTVLGTYLPSPLVLKSEMMKNDEPNTPLVLSSRQASWIYLSIQFAFEAWGNPLAI
jgi:hypothetical protein